MGVGGREPGDGYGAVEIAFGQPDPHHVQKHVKRGQYAMRRGRNDLDSRGVLTAWCGWYCHHKGIYT